MSSPTTDSGNRRAGFLIGASFLLVFGLGICIVANVVLHQMAPSHGVRLFFVTVYPLFGPYATFTLVLGVLATIVGLGMMSLGLNIRVGRVDLPDTEGPTQSP